MTAEKILEVIAIYRRFFIQEKTDKIDYPHEELLRSERVGLAHCHGMLDKMTVFIQEGRIEKAMRWMAFIQGVLWASGRFPLEELKNHNRP